MTQLEKIREEIKRATIEMDYETAQEALAVIDKYAEQEPCDTISYHDDFATALQKISKYEDRKASEDYITVKMKRGSLKSRQGDVVIYNVMWLKDHWQQEMDIVCGVKPCEDAVSRQAVLTIASLHTLTIDESVEAIKRLPSVQPKAKTGWHIAHGIYEDRFWCSCGYIKIIDSDTSKWNYCPNCGARMVEPQERSDKE